MLTAKVINTQDEENVFEINSVELLPRRVDVPSGNVYHSGVYLSLPNGTKIHYGFTPEDPEMPSTKRKRIYIMNDNGATIATYTL